MSIPLVQNNEKDSINTSIIAIKRNIERINMLLGLSNSEEIDTSEFVKKSDIVDEVSVGNMHSVTSNAVAVANSYSTTEQKTGGRWIDGKPIYRKVAVFSSELTVQPYTWTTTEVSNSGISTIINILGINGLGANFQISGTRDQGSYIRVLSYRNIDITVKTLILEYTKITD